MLELDAECAAVCQDDTGATVTLRSGRELDADAVVRRQSHGRGRVDVTTEMVIDSVHAYPIFAFLPETRDVLHTLRQWADRVQAVRGRA